MTRKGILTVVSGFSGVGKGTLMKALLERYPDNYALSISATSRAPRSGEENGREYFFKTKEEFEQMIKDDLLVEYAVYNGNYYGTPKEYVYEKLQEGKNVILEIEVQGGLQIKAKNPETVLMYVIPPTGKELYDRLTGRGTETPENIMNRMKRAVWECDYISLYETVVVNDDFERCLQEIHTLLQARQDELNARMENVERLKNEIENIIKGE